MPLAPPPNVHVERATDGKVRQLRHLQQPCRANVRGPPHLARQYVRVVTSLRETSIASRADAQRSA
jgi:hypothetical protein